MSSKSLQHQLNQMALAYFARPWEVRIYHGNTLRLRERFECEDEAKAYVAQKKEKFLKYHGPRGWSVTEPEYRPLEPNGQTR